MKKYAILLAAGKGSRMQTSVPKQFLLLKGKPLLLYSLEKFIAVFSDIEIILVLNQEGFGYWNNLKKSFSIPSNISIVAGGDTRAESVKNALDSIPSQGLVAIHDAARPFVPQRLIRKAFEAAEKFGNAIPGIPVQDSIFFNDKERVHTLNREKCFLAQTPQCFHLALIKEAYEMDLQSHFTDDAAVFESAGHIIYPIEGDPGNFKITTKADYQLAQLILGE